MSTITELSPDIKRCLRNCLDCYESCTHAAAHGLEMGGRHATSPHITLLQDCAGVCQLHAEFLMRTSPRQAALAAICADLCRSCAVECQKMSDDPIMEQCARVCGRCADSCDRMAERA